MTIAARSAPTSRLSRSFPWPSTHGLRHRTPVLPGDTTTRTTRPRGRPGVADGDHPHTSTTEQDSSESGSGIASALGGGTCARGCGPPPGASGTSHPSREPRPRVGQGSRSTLTTAEKRLPAVECDGTSSTSSPSRHRQFGRCPLRSGPQTADQPCPRPSGRRGPHRQRIHQSGGGRPAGVSLRTIEAHRSRCLRQARPADRRPARPVRVHLGSGDWF